MRTFGSTGILLALATTFAGAQTLPTTPPTMPQAQPAPALRAAPGDGAALMTAIPANAAPITQWHKQPIYDQTNTKIGDIDDVLVNREAKVVGFVIGVGGFLGMGETHVAVPFNSIQSTTKDNKLYLIMNTTKEALKAAPHFTYDRAAMVWKPAGPSPVTLPANPPVTPPNTMAQNNPSQPAAPRANSREAVVQTMPSIPTSTATITHWYKQPVYDPGDARIGEIDDVLLDADGKVAAFIIGVGGFLGVGERHLAVPYNAVRATTKDNNKWYLVMNTTADALKVAPHFKYNRTTLTWTPEAATTTGTSVPPARPNPPVAR